MRANDKISTTYYSGRVVDFLIDGAVIIALLIGASAAGCVVADHLMHKLARCPLLDGAAQ
jgi:hypothetical protein